MRHIGSSAYGVRLPILSPGDPLVDIIVDSMEKASETHDIPFQDGDVIGVTEAILAKAQNNMADFTDIAEDVTKLFGDDTIGVVFPIMSRNRFLGLLKSISMGAKKVKVLLSWPTDEVGNPIMDLDDVAKKEKELQGLLPGNEFKEIVDGYVHPFTGINYVDLYESAGDNIEVFVSNRPEDILELTDTVLVGEVHNRYRTKERLIHAGAKKVHLLSDILSEPRNPGDTSGFHPEYGVMGSNQSTDGVMKLFPKDGDVFVQELQDKILEVTGKKMEILIYGDGAYKDPDYGIWELADPVISPAYTEKLGNQPNELKLKYVADQMDKTLTEEEKRKSVEEMIEKQDFDQDSRQGTTPRKYADLLGSLCDLLGGSGDKGTPVIWIQGYFDNYSTK